MWLTMSQNLKYPCIYINSRYTCRSLREYYDNFKDSYICQKNYLFYKECIYDWYKSIPKNNKNPFPDQMLVFFTKKTRCDYFYCLDYKVTTWLIYNATYTAEKSNGILILVTPPTTDNINSWCISSLKCYPSGT